MSPTATIDLAAAVPVAVAWSMVGRGVPGVVGTGWVPGRAIPVPSQDQPQDPYLVIFKV